MTDDAHTDDHHPGPPRFMQVGEYIVDPVFADMAHGYDRDNLAPSIAGTPDRDPDNYDRTDFTWRVAEKPDASRASLEYAPTAYDEVTQYDHGLHNTVEFRPDVPGTYVFEVDAPEGTHSQTVRVFPPPTLGEEVQVFDIEGEVAGGADRAIGGPPRPALDGHYDADDEAFVLESNAELAPDAFTHEEDLVVEFLPHDAAGLEAEEITVEDGTARIPAAAVTERTSVFAAPFDGVRLGATDEAVLDPEAETVDLPNRPPEWLDDAVIYEIFTRSFAGAEGETDFGFLTSKVDYLDDLGVDVIWLTPIVPAWSAEIDTPPGGPHGYSTGDYFDVAEDLGTLEEFETFVEACKDRDIRVCFDLVVNHCGWTNDIWQDTIAELGPQPEDPYAFPAVEAWNSDSTYFDWFDRQATASETDAAPAQSSFFNERLQPNLNYGNLALREHVLAAVDFWSDTVDAFRCDIAWGVPHSFWKEARRLTREKDAEFMWLDESVPYLTSMAESEFDLHFDTTNFTFSAHAVVRGERPPSDLLDDVEKRQEMGFPEHSRIINATENHDESRSYHEAKVEGTREDPARAERGAIAAAFALPGVPMLYYGQERLIAEHGTRRTSPFEDRTDRYDDIEKDPYKRAFMNWEEYPEEHFEFVSDLVEFFHESPVLGPTADLVREGHRTEAPEDVLVFALENDGQCRVVVVNFGAETHEVELRPVVDTTDRFSGEDVGVDGDAGVTTVEVDQLVVLETPDLFGSGG